MDAVIYLYALNILLVAANMALYYIYKNRPDDKTDIQALEQKLEREVNLRENKEVDWSAN